jgi:hypothetical protein
LAGCARRRETTIFKPCSVLLDSFPHLLVDYSSRELAKFIHARTRQEDTNRDSYVQVTVVSLAVCHLNVLVSLAWRFCVRQSRVVESHRAAVAHWQISQTSERSVDRFVTMSKSDCARIDYT